MRVLVLAATLLLLAACGKSAEDTAVEAMTGAKVDKDGDKVTLKTEQGDVVVNTSTGQSLPADFPKDVFLPDGYTVRSSMDMAGTLVVDMEAPGASADVFAQAGKAMPGQGWKQTAALQSGGQSVLVFENADRTVQYSFLDDVPGKTHVAMQVIKKQP